MLEVGCAELSLMIGDIESAKEYINNVPLSKSKHIIEFLMTIERLNLKNNKKVNAFIPYIGAVRDVIIFGYNAITKMIGLQMEESVIWTTFANVSLEDN